MDLMQSLPGMPRDTWSRCVRPGYLPAQKQLQRMLACESLGVLCVLFSCPEAAAEDAGTGKRRGAA